MPPPVLSIRTLNRTYLARQLLLTRSEMGVSDALEHLVGLQAQMPASPYTALWSRLVDFNPRALSTLIAERRAVRMVLMRATIHLVTAGDARGLRPVVQPVLDRELFDNRTWAGGVAGVDLEPVLAYGRELVEERPRSMPELRQAMSERWPDRDAGTLAYAIRNLLPTVQVPPRGLWGRSGGVALTTLDHWTGRPMDAGFTAEEVVLRYLRAFGPATTADVAAWSRLTGVGEIVERMGGALIRYRDERGRELLDVADGELVAEDAPAPVRFLPDFDNALLGHRDRSRIIPAALADVVRSRIGTPTVLVNGFVAATWKLVRAGRSAQIHVEPLATLPAMPSPRSRRRACNLRMSWRRA